MTISDPVEETRITVVAAVDGDALQPSIMLSEPYLIAMVSWRTV